MSEDDITGRSTPPKTPEEWAYIWRGARWGHASWVIVGPLHAFITNWKAWVAGILFLLWINRPEVLAALSVVLGVE